MTMIKLSALPHQIKTMKKMCQLEKTFIEYNNIKIKTKIGIITDPSNSGKSTTLAFFEK